MLKFVKAPTKKVSKIESTRSFRMLSSGLKLTSALVKSMGVIIPKKGEEDGDRSFIHFAKAEGDIYLYVNTEGDGGIVGSNKCFGNSQLSTELLALAGLDGSFEVKNRNSVWFTIAPEGVESEGVTYWKVEFDKVVTSAEASEEDEDEGEEDNSLENL